MTKAWKDEQAQVKLDKEKFPENSKSPIFFKTILLKYIQLTLIEYSL